MHRKIEKQCIPVFFDEDGEPVALIFYSKNRERVIHLLKKADEEEIVALFEGKDLKIPVKNGDNNGGGSAGAVGTDNSSIPRWTA